MDTMGELVTVGTGGLGGRHGSHEEDVVVLHDEGLKVQVFLRWQKASAQIV
jgi:hypothetical protein